MVDELLRMKPRKWQSEPIPGGYRSMFTSNVSSFDSLVRYQTIASPGKSKLQFRCQVQPAYSLHSSTNEKLSWNVIAKFHLSGGSFRARYSFLRSFGSVSFVFKCPFFRGIFRKKNLLLAEFLIGLEKIC